MDIDNVQLLEEIKELQQQVSRLQLNQKEVLSLEDLTQFLPFKKSYIYDLVKNEKIPYHKPTGGILLFMKDEIIDWIRAKPRDIKEEKFQLLKKKLNI